MEKKFMRLTGFAAGLIFATAVFAGQLSPQAARKLDPKLRLLATEASFGQALAKGAAAAFLSENGASVKVMVKTNGGTAELRAHGARIMAVAGDIATAIVPLARLGDIAALNSVVYIEASKNLKLRNDVGRVETRTAAVQQQFNYTGRGVLVGVLDSGIDWRHDDFRKANGQTRIKYLLDFSTPGLGPYGGSLYNEAFINDALNGIRTIPQADRNGHGTHVAGSAAGNGRGTSNGVPAGTYAGAAPEADLIFIKSSGGDLGSIPDLDVINAAAFLDSIAGVLGQPYVLNLSLGSHEGAHDGTSLQEQALDNLIGPNKRGKAIVVSAGNEGQDDVHAGGNMNGAAINIDFNVPAFAPNDGASTDYVLFDGWYTGAASTSVRLTAPNGTSYGPVATGGRFSQDTPNGAIIIDNANGGTNPLNGDRQVFIQIFDFTATRPPASGNWRLTITGNTGRYDLWLHNSSMNAALTSNISYSRLVGIPGTARNVITVGAWVTKRTWMDVDGNTLTVGATIGSTADFSSPGPSRDGRIKPEISAPGQMIGSTLSNDARPNGQYSIWKSSVAGAPNAYILRDDRHAIGNGTSFASPLVAGGIALLLQSNPNLDAAQIRKALTSTARADAFTGTVPNDRWGYGKVDFLAALNYVTSVDEKDDAQAAPQAFALLPNHPNPFNPVTQIAYELPRAAHVDIAVFDMLGRKVRTLVSTSMPAGRHETSWDGRNEQGLALSSGVYLYKMQAGNFITARKLVLAR